MRYKNSMIFINEKRPHSYFQTFWRWSAWSLAFAFLFLLMAEILRVSVMGTASLRESSLLQKMESVLPGVQTYSGSSMQWAHNQIWNFLSIDLQCHIRGQACLRRWSEQKHAWLPLDSKTKEDQQSLFFKPGTSFEEDQALTWPLIDESSRPWVVLSSIQAKDPVFHYLTKGNSQHSYFFESLTSIPESLLHQLSKYLFFVYDSRSPSKFSALQVSELVDCSKNPTKCGQEGVSEFKQGSIFWIQFLPRVDVSHLIPQVPEGLYKFSSMQQGFSLFPLGLEYHQDLFKNEEHVFGKFLDVVQWKVEKNFGSSDFQLIQKSLLNQDVLPFRKNIGAYGAVIVYQPKSQQWSLDLLADQITSDLQISVRERIPLALDSHYLGHSRSSFQSPIYFHQPNQGGVFWSSDTSRIQHQEQMAKFVWGLRWKRKFAKTEDQFFIPLSYIDQLQQDREGTRFISIETMEEVAPSDLFQNFAKQISKIGSVHGKDFEAGELSINLEGQLCQDWLYRPLATGTQVYQIPRIFSHMHEENVSDPTQVPAIRSGMQMISWSQEFQRITQAASFQELHSYLIAWSKFEWRVEQGQDIPLISFSDRGSQSFKNKAYQKSLQLAKKPTEENWISFLSEMDHFYDQLCDSNESWIWDLWPIPKICKLSKQSTRRFSSYISPLINYDLFKQWVQKQLILHMALEWEEQLDFQFRSGILPLQKVECRQPIIQNLNWKNERTELSVHFKSSKESFRMIETMIPDQWTWIFKKDSMRGSYE